MKKIVLIFILLLSTAIITQAQHRWYPFKTKPVYGYMVQDTIHVSPINEVSKDSTLFFGPSVSFDIFQKEHKTGDYKLGVIPGVGYGIKWNPLKWKKNYLLGLDVFAQGNLRDIADSDDPSKTNKYFTVDFIPVLTILNWVHIGYGPRWNIGVNGTPNMNTGVFIIGITKEL
jgi:hypothetical protein